MANISNIVNVALIPEGQLAGVDNMNICALMTSELGVLSTANRYESYTDIQAVAADFGTDGSVYSHASAFFAQTPNPVNAGGRLVIGYWRASNETVAATAAALTGAQVSEAIVVDAAQSISDGSFDVTVDGVTKNITAVDLRTVESLDDIATVLDAAISGAGVSVVDSKFIVTSDTTGVTSTITLFTNPGSGTYLGSLLALESGSGAVVSNGADAGVETAETKTAAVTALKALINFKGVVFVDDVSDADVALLAAWGEANDVLNYDVFSAAANLERDVSNIVWTTKLAKQTKYRMLYSATNNRLFATAYMSRAHVVNFSGENTALTMHLKELSNVVAEDYTQTQIDKAKSVGLDIYTSVKDVPVILTSGANDFVDNVYNLMSFIDAVQTNAFNLLKATGTKMPQTKRGVDRLVANAEKTAAQYVRAGVFAPGTWTSSDYFGDVNTFKRSILSNGFYVLAGELSDQSAADRANRISPTMQVAVKNSGAIHKVDIIINFNL